MPDDKNHTPFTATDIERYHKGLLSAPEMNALEKAALEDPFLADALEGYAVPGVNAGADITELETRLAERTGGAKIIPMHRRNRVAFPWLKVAAVVVLVAGAGFLLYQFGFNKKPTEVARLEPKKEEVPLAKDSSANNRPAITPTNQTVTLAKKETVSNPVAQKNIPAKPITTTYYYNGSTYHRADTSISNNSQGLIAFEKKLVQSKAVQSNESVASGKTSTKEDSLAFNRDMTAKIAEIHKDTDDDIVKDQVDKQNFLKNKATLFSRKADNSNKTSNIFRGRVTDASNNPVPFANIINTEDNVGTYSDARGYFNLTSPDSILNIQIRSIGFENSVLQLRNSVASNQVVMQDDHKTLAETVLSNKKTNAAAITRGNIKVEESEPEDGWDNYDAYVANNLIVPEEIRSKQNPGDVEISFEVDKNGEPINIKVEKSLCSKCDKEAIRLIKQGPKWKHRTKNGRTIVMIPFNSF